MRTPTRIRLLKVPDNREHELTYPTLLVKVVDAAGNEWVTPTLAEAIVHLRSTEGARLIIEDHHYEWMGDVGSSEKRVAHCDTRDHLVIDRTGHDFVVRDIAAGPHGFSEDPEASPMIKDLSLDPPVRVVGRMTCKTVDVEVDYPQPWPPAPPPEIGTM